MPPGACAVHLEVQGMPLAIYHESLLAACPRTAAHSEASLQTLAAGGR